MISSSEVECVAVYHININLQSFVNMWFYGDMIFDVFHTAKYSVLFFRETVQNLTVKVCR